MFIVCVLMSTWVQDLYMGFDLYNLLLGDLNLDQWDRSDL